MGTAQQIFPISGVTVTPPLNPFTTNLWAAYSLRKMLSTATSAVRVRRSSDNTEQDIGFVGNAFDSTSLLSFVGAGDGFITKWYDQSGNVRDFAQATAANQPQIVFSGNFFGFVIFDPTATNYLTTVATSGTPTAFTMHLSGRYLGVPQGTPVGSTGGIGLFHNGGATVGYFSVAYDNSVGAPASWVETTVFTGQNSGSVHFAETLMRDSKVYTMTTDLAAGSLASQNLLYTNGVLQGGTSVTGTVGTGSYSAGTWALGASSVPTAPSQMAVETALIYETAQSAGTISSIVPIIQTTQAVGALDSYTTNLTGLYSLRKQRSAYAGSCLRVRRSSDSTEQDIGFTAGGVIDSAAMLTFVGAGNGFVSKWYDQSAAANDLVQATAANQPLIVSSGTYLGAVRTDGSTSIMSQVSNSGTPTAFTTYIQAYSLTQPAVADYLNHALTSSDVDFTFTWQSASRQFVFAVIGAAGNAVSGVWGSFGNQIMVGKADRTAGTFAGTAVFYEGGKKLVRDSSNDTGSVPSGTFAAKKWNIGARPTVVSACSANYAQVAIYETAHTDLQIRQICMSLGSL